MVIAQIAVDPMDHFFSDPIFSSFFDKPFWQVFRRQHCRLSICENWLSWTNTVSEQKIQITILILKRGPCLVIVFRI